MSAATPLNPTFYGHIASTQDALILFEACLGGALGHVNRRPHDRERVDLIKSGNVFIYEEHSSGIKRWTDGVPWSPSRILGNFLVYRELERPFPPGEKKRAMKRSRRPSGLANAHELYGSMNTDTDVGVNNYATDYASRSLSTTASASTSASIIGSSPANTLDRDTERALIGSLVDSYGFKEDGLVKKTLSVIVGSVSHHLVSYYTVADVMNNNFTTPSKDPRFQHLTPRHELITKQNFRAPIDEVDSMDRMDTRAVCSAFPHLRNGYEMTNQSISHQNMPLSVPPIPYMASNMCNNYGIGTNAITYDSLPAVQANNNYHGQYVPVPGIYPVSKPENYSLSSYKQPQPRYSTLMDIGAESGRSLPSFNTNYMRRPSMFEETNSIDSGLTELNTSSVSSRFGSESSYASQGLYGSFKDSESSSHNDPLQKPLPSPNQQGIYDRPTHGYTTVDNPRLKENIWPMGNAGVGHGHCLATQQQWTSTGTS